MSDREACYRKEGQCVRARTLELRLKSAVLKQPLPLAGASDKEKAPDKSVIFRLGLYFVVTD